MMKFRLRILFLVAVTVIVIYTYLILFRTDFNDASQSVNNDYIDIHDGRMDEWDLGPDPKWVREAHGNNNNVKSTSQNEARPRAKRLTVSERVNKYINMYRPKWNYHLNATSPWSLAAKWVTSRQIVGAEATELGMNIAIVLIHSVLESDVDRF